MATFESTVTNNGTNLLSQAIGSGTPLTLTRAVIGDGKPTSGENPATFTALKNQTLDGLLGEMSYQPDDTGYIQIPVQVTNQGVLAPTYVREIGIYARVGAGSEVLYAYAYTTDEADGGDNTLLPPPADVEYNVVRNYVMAVYISILDVGSVTVNVSPNTMIKYTQMQEYVDPRITALQNLISNLTGDDINATAPSENASWTTVQKYLAGIWASIKGLSGKKSSDFATAVQGVKADNALPSANYTAADVFAKVKSLSTSGAGLDSDYLDGQHGSYYLNYNNLYNRPTIPTVPSAYTGTPSALGVASSGSSAQWARGDHVHKLPTPAEIGALGAAQTAADSSKFGGQLPAYYLNYSNLTNRPTIYQPTSSTPQPLGIPSVGTSTYFARADHVHELPSLSTLGAQKTISYGTSAPSGGSNGDIYIQY